jgi:hypothetical protein
MQRVQTSCIVRGGLSQEKDGKSFIAMKGAIVRANDLSEAVSADGMVLGCQ